LHTVDSIQTVDRIVDVFPTHSQQQVRMQLSVNLVGVLSQTLVKRKDGRGRIAAFESLVATPAVRNLIRENKTYQINSVIQTGARQKMQTLDQSLSKLHDRGLVSLEEARSRSKDQGEFDRLVSLGKKDGQSKQDAAHTAQDDDKPKPPSAQGVRGQPWRSAFRKD
jgi:twitching motility protein PilT